MLLRFFAGLLLIGAVLAVLQRGRTLTGGSESRSLVPEPMPASVSEVRPEQVAPGKGRPNGFLPVKVAGLNSEVGVVYLKAEAHEKPFLRVYIDPVTTHSIAAALSGRRPPRPLPHDLFVATMHEMEVEVEGADVVALRSGTFYAVLRLRKGRRTFPVDSRPSDAIAIALRAEAPIRIKSEVLDEAGFAFPAVETEDAAGEHTLPGSERDL